MTNTPEKQVTKKKDRLSFTDLLFIASIPITIIGGLGLMYYYYVDGIYVNKVIEYREDINPQAFKLEKHEYKRGETPRFLTAFCKNKEATATTVWALANDVLTIYPPTEHKGAPQGCYPSGEGYTFASLREIPQDATNGCNHYFIGTVTRDYGGGRTQVETIKTETFCVI